jgi:hypothetical protein
MKQLDGILFSERQEFYSRDVVKLCKIGRPRFQTWIDGKYITPSIYKSDGTGRDNVFSAFDLVMISVFKVCTDLGMSRDDAAIWLPEIENGIISRDFSDGWEEQSIIYIFFLREGRNVTDIIIRDYAGESGLDFSVVAASMAENIVAINFSRIVRDIKDRLI